MRGATLALAGMLVLAVLLSACGGQAPAPGAGDGSSSVAYTVLPFEEVKIDEVPEAVRDWSAGYLEEAEPQATRFDHEGKTYILVTFGQKPTAGYSVEIAKVADNEGRLEVVARLKQPGPDEVVAQVITYPAALVRIDATGAQGLEVIREGDTTSEDDGPFWHPATSNDLVEGVSDWVNGLKETQGIFHRNFVGRTYVLVAWGEKPSGGYRVEVEDASAEEGKLLLDVKLTAPKAGEPVPEVLTYPYALIVVRHPGPWVYEARFEGAPFGDEPTENQAFRLESPAPHDVVNSGFLLKGEARVFEATFQAVLEDGHDVLWQKTLVASEAAPGWGTFEERVEFDVPTSAFGTLRVFEYSAKDGSVVNERVIPVQFGTWAEAK